MTNSSSSSSLASHRDDRKGWRGELNEVSPQLLSKSESCLPASAGSSTCSSSVGADDDSSVESIEKSDDAERRDTDAGKTTRTRSYRFVVLSVILLLACASGLFHVVDHQMGENLVDTESVYVSGGGFSGFWFTLGRLKSIENPDADDKSYYCYSAGCLAVVATLSNFTMEEVYENARDKQLKWQTGRIDRYDVVEAFLDEFIYDTRTSSEGYNVLAAGPLTNKVARIDPTLLSKLFIITSEWRGWFGGLKRAVRTPTNPEELHDMLMQSTWIPYATGRHLWHKNHMDGGFTGLFHPRCKYYVGLAPDLDLFLNIVNVNLGRDKVERLWNKGLSYGL